jgi:hypothetical protein
MAGNKEYDLKEYNPLNDDMYLMIRELFGQEYNLKSPENGTEYTELEKKDLRDDIIRVFYGCVEENLDKKEEILAKLKDPRMSSKLKIRHKKHERMIEKLEKAYKRTEENPYLKKLKENKWYQMAVKLGLMEEATSANELSANELIKKASDMLATTELNDEQRAKLNEEEQKSYNEHFNPTVRNAGEHSDDDKPSDEVSPEEKTEGKTTTAEAILENKPEEPVHQDLSWIEQKRKFWKKYAADIAHEFKEEKPEDNSAPTFEGSLVKGEESKGSVKYTSANRVEISRDSKLVMYQGVIKDVIESGNTLTLGETLNQTQKLMFYAAALSSTERYEDGSKIKVINPPALTPEVLKSKEFEALDPDVKKILSEEYKRIEAEAQERTKIEAEIAAKKRYFAIGKEIKDVHQAIEKAGSDKEKLELQRKELQLVKEKLGIDTKYNIANQENRHQLRQAQLGLMRDTFDGNKEKPLFKHEIKREDGKIDTISQEQAERNAAARMGIISDVKTSDGKEVKKDEKYAERKMKQNPLYEKYLTERYASKE